MWLERYKKELGHLIQDDPFMNKLLRGIVWAIEDTEKEIYSESYLEWMYQSGKNLLLCFLDGVYYCSYRADGCQFVNAADCVDIEDRDFFESHEYIKSELERRIYMNTDKHELREKVIQSNTFIQKRTTEIQETKKEVIRSVSAFDETQIKLINLMISHIKPDADSFQWEEISFYEFLTFMQLKPGGNSYKKIFESIKSLMSLNFCIEKTPGEFVFYHFFESGSTVSINENKILLKFDDALKPYFLGLERNYTRYELGFLSFLKGKYTCRLYEYLHSFLNLKTPIYISVDDLQKKICNCSYNTITDLERYVLEKALSEINEKSDIRFSYKRKQVKNKGRFKTIGWTFTIKEKSAKEKQKVAQGWGIEDAAFIIQKTNSLTAAQEEKTADYNPFTDPNVEPVF